MVATLYIKHKLHNTSRCVKPTSIDTVTATLNVYMQVVE